MSGTTKATVIRRLKTIEIELVDALNAVQTERGRRERAKDNDTFTDVYASKLVKLVDHAARLHDEITSELG